MHVFNEAILIRTDLRQREPAHRGMEERRAKIATPVRLQHTGRIDHIQYSGSRLYSGQTYTITATISRSASHKIRIWNSFAEYFRRTTRNLIITNTTEHSCGIRKIHHTKNCRDRRNKFPNMTFNWPHLQQAPVTLHLWSFISPMQWTIRPWYNSFYLRWLYLNVQHLTARYHFRTCCNFATTQEHLRFLYAGSRGYSYNCQYLQGNDHKFSALWFKHYRAMGSSGGNIIVTAVNSCRNEYCVITLWSIDSLSLSTIVEMSTQRETMDRQLPMLRWRRSLYIPVDSRRTNQCKHCKSECRKLPVTVTMEPGCTSTDQRHYSAICNALNTSGEFALR